MDERIFVGGINYAFRTLAVFSLIVFFSWPVCAQDKVLGEDMLKALYSYKFVLFTDWPKDRQIEKGGDSLSFCIIGRNPFGLTALESIQGQPAHDKTILVDVYGSGVVSEESLSHCQVAFISGSEVHRVPVLLHALKPFPILTISDIPGFSNQGGMITLVKSDEHIKFEVNLGAIKQANLALSSKIIELATVVKTSDEGRN